MSTKLRPPLVPRRPPGVAVVAAAPLLLLLVLASSSGSPPVAVATGSPELVELTLLPGAQEKGAVCLDGPTGLPSAERLRVRIPQLARLSDFYDWNKVLIRYCDGASFSGDAKGGDQDGTKLFFRGLRIWEVVLDELMGIGLPEAKPALLAGCSAGGLATLLHCDNFRARFPQEVLVKCLKDAGFFLDIKDVSGERFMRSFCNGVVHLQNVRKVFPKDCLAKKDPTECFFAAELIKSISTPTFILNSDYDSWQIGNVLAPNGSYPGDSWSSCKANIRNCSSEQIDVLHGFRKKLVHDLKVAEHKRDWGLFIDSCFTHCQTPSNISWHSRISPRLGDIVMFKSFEMYTAIAQPFFCFALDLHRYDITSFFFPLSPPGADNRRGCWGLVFW